jgi:hypothetical protein
MCWEWFNTHEGLGVWIEAIALILIFGIDSVAFWRQGKDRVEARKQFGDQLDVSRKQIHADRVAGIFQSLRTFMFVVSDGIRYDSFGVGRRFEYSDIKDLYGEPEPMKEFAAIHEAHHLAILINDALAAYIGARVAEAAALQGVNDHVEFGKRLEVFWKNWEGKKMAEALRKLL